MNTLKKANEQTLSIFNMRDHNFLDQKSLECTLKVILSFKDREREREREKCGRHKLTNSVCQELNEFTLKS